MEHNRSQYPFRCHRCEANLDGISDIAGDPTQPRVGDVTICIYCVTLYQMSEHGWTLIDEKNLEGGTNAERRRLHATLNIIRTLRRRPPPG